MRIPEKAVEEVLRKSDLVEVARSFIELRKAGGNDFTACCPFHDERTPSFHINAAKQVYHCFGCGAGGNLITFVKAMVHTDYVGALRYLAQQCHVDLPEEEEEGPGGHQAAMLRRKLRDDGMRLLEDAAGWFESNLHDAIGAEARQYLAARGIDDETVKKYRLGYAPQNWDALRNWAHSRGTDDSLLEATGLIVVKNDPPGKVYDRFRNRLIFPICDELSRVVGFSGRVFAGNAVDVPKYVNSPESDYFHKGRLFYGFNFARAHFKEAGWALVCEGQLDVIACHRAGLHQAVAGQGTAFTEEHAKMLRRTGVPCVHLAYDGDNAGAKAAVRTIGILQQEGMQVMITHLPAGEDPDSIFRKGGGQALNQMMSVSEQAIPFVFRTARQRHPEFTPEARSAVVSETLASIATLTDAVAASGYCQWLAQQLGLPENVVFDQLTVARQSLAAGKDASSRRDFFRSTPLEAAADRQFSIPVSAVTNRGALYPVLEILLEIALNSQEGAAKILEHEELLDVLPDCAATSVLMQLLAAVHDREWEGLVHALPQTSAADDPAVSKALACPQLTAGVSGDAETIARIYDSALNDCFARLERMRLERREAEVARNLADAGSNYQALNQLRELARQKKQLRRK